MMASCLTLHSQLSSIMETMAKSVLSQVCKLVDEDSTELRLELSRLLAANSTLSDKVTNLERRLTAVRSKPSKLSKSHRSVGVQTVCYRDDDACVSGSPTIAGIFGKDWCMNLWKDIEPYSLERATDAPQSSEKSVVTLSDQVTVTEIKGKDSVEGTTSSCQQDTLPREELEASMTDEPEQLPDGYFADSSTCSRPLDQNADQVVSAGGIEEPSINDTEESFSTYIIPIEEDDDDDDDDDDDVQFIQESQEEPTMSAAGGPSHIKQQTLPANLSENSSALDKDSHDCNMVNLETARASNQDNFTCQICSRTFFHKRTLTQHTKSHKSNFCSICEQHFPRKNKFISHTCVPPVRSQTIRKSCELCGKTFANVSALRIHSVVHTGEKPYRCSLCGKGFTQKGNLKCHLRIHTGEKPFRCVICGQTFKHKAKLAQHFVTHRNHEVVEEKPKRRRKNVAE